MLVMGIVYNLSWLLLFKYLPLLLRGANLLISFTGIGFRFPQTALPLPLGISFYTFQAVSYLADVYRRKCAPEHSLRGFASYMAMFPQLISGPLVSFQSIRMQLLERIANREEIEEGLRTFTIGLGLKVLLANQLSGLWAKMGTIGYESLSTPLAWIGIIAFSLQIYFDFCGYSLMAQGAARVLGFSIPDNFHHPYMSVSMTEFWRRWHITLGAWFRDYVYIPLGGSRAGRLNTFRNLFVVWMLTGMWHGASLNFVLWGLFLFAVIAIEKSGWLQVVERWRLIGHLYMMLIIPLSWLIFAIPNLPELGVYLGRLFPVPGWNQEAVYSAGDYLKYLHSYGISLAAGLLFATNLPMRVYERFKNGLGSAILLLIVFWASVYCIARGMNDPFMYFAF